MRASYTHASGMYTDPHHSVTLFLHCYNIQPGEELETHEAPRIQAKVRRVDRGKMIPASSK